MQEYERYFQASHISLVCSVAKITLFNLFCICSPRLSEEKKIHRCDRIFCLVSRIYTASAVLGKCNELDLEATRRTSEQQASSSFRPELKEEFIEYHARWRAFSREMQTGSMMQMLSSQYSYEVMVVSIKKSTFYVELVCVIHVM